jgi:hypothetical protein
MRIAGCALRAAPRAPDGISTRLSFNRERSRAA